MRSASQIPHTYINGKTLESEDVAALLKQPTGFTIDWFKCITLLKWNELILIYQTTKELQYINAAQKDQYLVLTLRIVV